MKHILGTIRLIFLNLVRSDIRVRVRSPKDNLTPQAMETGETFTITTGKSKIVVRKLGFRSLEIVLIPASYVEKNWENCND